MRIDSLKLCNYRVFHGTHSIRFHPRGGGEHGKTLTVIMGNNGAGKSVILDSVIFALFGKDRRKGGSEPDYSSIMNRYAREKGFKECYVQLQITMEGSSFLLRRNLYQSGNTKVTIKGRGLGRGPDEVLSRLRSRITPDSAKYLFFSFRSDPAQKLRLTGRDAINSFLGINVLESAVRNLDIYHGKIMEHLARNTRAKELTSLRKRLKGHSLRKDRIKKKMEEVGNASRKLKMELRKLTAEACRIKGLGRVLNLNQRLQKKIYKLKKELSGTGDRTGIYEMTPYFLIKDHITEALASVRERVERRDRIRYKLGKLDAQLELVETLFEPGIRTGRCGLCENKVRNTTEALSEVSKLKEELGSETDALRNTYDLIEVPPEMDMDGLNEVVMVLERYMSDLNRMMKERADRISEIKQLQTATKNLLMRFPSLTRLDGDPASRQNLQGYVDRIADRRRNIYDAQLRSATLRQEYRDVQEQYEEDYSAFRRITTSMRTSMGRFVSKMDMSKRALRAVMDTIDDIQKENREMIEAGLNRILAGLFSKKGLIERVLIRKDDYSLAVRIATGGEGRSEMVDLDEFSDGEKVLIFISLIWALNRLDGGTTVLYDSPFSFLDETNKRAIARNLSRLPGHQIMLTTRDDLTGIHEDVLGRAGRIYEIIYDGISRSSRIVPKRAMVTRRMKRLKGSKGTGIKSPGSRGRGDEA